ncbi:MAG: transcription-repair coupling factor [candidate division KSB1 bacterium]|nr:transcription-repair coupling factor [candidate division KSB1 bacterium]
MAIELIKKAIAESEAFEKLLDKVKQRVDVETKGLHGSFRSLMLALLYENLGSSILYVTSDEEHAELIKDDLEVILDPENVSYLPDQRDRPYETVFTDNNRKGYFQESLERIVRDRPSIVITTAQSLSKKIISPNLYKKQQLKIVNGHSYAFEEIKSRLIDLDFSREPMAENCGEMSIRGGIIDVYPFAREHPVRIEFFGDTVESIREFDPETQRSIRKLEQLNLYPQFPEDSDTYNHTGLVSLFDYFDEDTSVILDESRQVVNVIDNKYGEAENAYHTRSSQVSIQPPEELYLSRKEIKSRLKQFRTVYCDTVHSTKRPVVQFSVNSQESFRGNFKLLKKQIDEICESDDPYNIHFFCESGGQIERLEDIMSDVGIDTAIISFHVYPLFQGFIFKEGRLAIFTDNQFYGRVRRRFRRKRMLSGLSLRQLNALKAGDYIVHVDHGIGIYSGLKKIKVNNNERECIVLEYRDKDRLYVPLEKMQRVQKYSAKEGSVPQISKLGGMDWEKLKSRTKKKVKDIARELIDIYARRKDSKGFSFSKDTTWQKELEASFAFEDTPDQQNATRDIKRDMENRSPMDRIVCGDVGYGKTEVALRAAFKAVNDNKQVVVLVPTTVLALQHYNTFRERLAQFPVKVEMLSRFRSRAEQKKIVEWIKEKKVDIVIGTHRLLSRDIIFDDLGLIIIDEEQRFGVKHKEKLKKLKVSADILTMTATPIPRTLNMALMGVRDMSLINTPPQGRLPIATDVIPFDKKLIRMAILKEVERGGQIFFVHNRVKSIYAMAGLLRRLIPEVSFAVAHGQMDETELEKIMWDFSEGKYNCLLSTMIIESGLDIPNVNTLIINRADQFGLSQLYQLRGRVGRSNQRAYAYLIVPPIQQLTQGAIKRLRTIEEFTELGSGFQIAMRDLQIRGAGNILGGEQSGFIVSLGYDMYTKIVEDAVEELRNEKLGIQGKSKEDQIEVKVDLNADAYIPDSYVGQPEERVRVYKILAEATRVEAVDDVKHELVDRFGPMPSEAQNLIFMIYLKVVGAQLGLTRITINDDSMNILFDEHIVDKELINRRVVSIVDKAAGKATFYQSKGNALGLRLDLKKIKSNSIEYSKNFLQSLL